MIKYDKKNFVSKDCKIVKYGKYDEDIDTGEITIGKAIDEFTFYKIYLELNNVIGWKNINGELVNIKISDAPVELMAYIMTKDLDYTLLYRNKDSKLIDLGTELGRSSNSIYASITRLRSSGYLIKDEDNLFVPNDEIRYVMIETKKSIKEKGYIAFDYLFKFCVK